MTFEVPPDFIVTTLDRSVKSGGPYDISESTATTIIRVLDNRPTLVEEEEGRPTTWWSGMADFFRDVGKVSNDDGPLPMSYLIVVS